MSIDPYQTLLKLASDLGLHCLQLIQKLLFFSDTSTVIKCTYLNFRINVL